MEKMQKVDIIKQLENRKLFKESLIQLTTQEIRELDGEIKLIRTELKNEEEAVTKSSEQIMSEQGIDPYINSSKH